MLTALLDMLGLSYAKAIGILVVLAALAGAYFYVTGLQSKYTEQVAMNREMGYMLIQEQVAHNHYKERVNANQKELAAANQEIAVARMERDAANRKVADLRLSKLASAKPGLVTRFARRATERLWVDFETETPGDRETDLPVSTPGGQAGPAGNPADSRNH